MYQSHYSQTVFFLRFAIGYDLLGYIQEGSVNLKMQLLGYSDYLLFETTG